MASKSLLPLPDKWAGLEDEDIRLRKRYLDLVATADLRELFRKKMVFWDTFRNALKKEGFLEVELPVLENLPGGAEAEPFKTHHNALDTDFYLRISLELPLKKLWSAGSIRCSRLGGFSATKASIVNICRITPSSNFIGRTAIITT